MDKFNREGVMMNHPEKKKDYIPRNSNEIIREFDNEIGKEID